MKIQSWRDTPWWHRAIITALLVGCLPIVANVVDGHLWIGHNFFLVVLVIFPVWVGIAMLVATPVFYLIGKRRGARGAGGTSPRATTDAPTAREVPEGTMRHFSQANPRGRGQEDLSTLLRSVATSIATLGHVHVHDITFTDTIDDVGRMWPSMTVYYTNQEEPEV